MDNKRKSDRDNDKVKSIKKEKPDYDERSKEKYRRTERSKSRSRSRSRDREREHGREHRETHNKYRNYRNRNREEDSDKHYEYGKTNEESKDQVPIEKEKPSLALSGNLLKDTNTYNGVVVNYVEPSEARKPRKRWRLYCFKGDQELPFYQIHRQSAYLFGRDRKVADIPVDHPSCSKQHAVFQYRLVDYKRNDGTTGRIVKPYIIDLGSTNGTYINNSRVEAQRYYELKEKDVLKFGFSTRDFVLLHEGSKNDFEEDFSYESGSDDNKSDKDEQKK